MRSAQLFVQERGFRWLASGNIFRSVAGVVQFVERVPFAAIMQSRTAVHANIIMLAIVRAAMELRTTCEEPLIPHFRAPEAEERLCIAIWYLIWPIAAITFRVESQPLGTVKNIPPTVCTVHKLTAVLMISNLEIAILMGTILRWLGRLAVRSSSAVYVDRVAAGIIESGFRVEKKTLRAEFLLRYTIDTFYIGVALIRDRKSSISFLARTRCLSLRNIVHQLVIRARETLIVGQRGCGHKHAVGNRKINDRLRGHLELLSSRYRNRHYVRTTLPRELLSSQAGLPAEERRGEERTTMLVAILSSVDLLSVLFGSAAFFSGPPFTSLFPSVCLPLPSLRPQDCNNDPNCTHR